MGRFDSYSGLLTAYPYAFRQSASWLFRSYVVVSALLGVLFAFLMVGALLVLIGNTAGARGGSLTLSRTFYVVVGLFVFAPLVGPVLLVARRHRRETPVAPRYDVALAVAGYLFVLSVYLGLVVSTPPSFRESGVGPVVESLYALPALAGLVPPLVGALVVYAGHRRYRSKGRNDERA
jgi:cytochrome bd-type quinol oxidase subunit 2